MIKIYSCLSCFHFFLQISIFLLGSEDAHKICNQYYDSQQIMCVVMSNWNPKHSPQDQI